MRLYRLGALLVLSSFPVRAALAQNKPSGSEIIPLTVHAGVPFHVVLEKAVPIKHEGVPVEGRVVDPVYVFDHLVIPAGTQILGHVTRVEGVSRKQRALAITNGDFTPLRKARVDFDRLVLKDGRQIPLQTVVSQGIPNVVHLSAGERGKKKGRVSQAVQQARQEAKARAQETVSEIKAPGKMHRLKSMLAAELPYHKQTLAAGTQFTAELRTPLQLGQEDRSPGRLKKIGGEIPPGSVVRVRLVTALSSATDHKGSAVEAVVSEPVFSHDHQLILPEGSRLEGVVTQSRPARRLGRNGQLRFMFRQIEVSTGAPRQVEASLQGVDAASGAHLQLDAEGGAHAITPKTRFIAPAIDVLLATSSLDGLDPHNHRRIEEGLGRQGPDVAGGTVRGGAGFGLVGALVGLLAHYRPISAGFAFYGAGLSVYSHIVARGTDVVFPKNTAMEIRFGTHEGSTSPADKGKPFVSQISKPTKSS
ncbi:MAG: hypothetical protein ACRD3T_17360 [Terriglobia bacterium]